MGTEGASIMLTSSRFYLAKNIPNLPVMVKMEIDNLDETAAYNDFHIRLFKRPESKGIVTSVLEGIAEKSIFFVPSGCTLRINASDLLEVVDSDLEVIATLPLVDDEQLLYPRISIGGGSVKQPQIDPDTGTLFPISLPVDGNIADEPEAIGGLKKVLFDVKYGIQEIANSVITLGSATNQPGNYMFNGVAESESIPFKIVTDDYTTLEGNISTMQQTELIVIPFEDYFLNVSPSTVLLDESAKTNQTVSVMSNMNWSATGPEWVTFNTAMPISGDSTLSYNVSELSILDSFMEYTLDDPNYSFAAGSESDIIRIISRDHKNAIVGDQMLSSPKLLRLVDGNYIQAAGFDILVSGSIQEVVISPSGDYLAMLYDNGVDADQLAIYKLIVNADESLTQYVKLSDPLQFGATSLKFSNDGLRLVGKTPNNEICIYQYSEWMGEISFGRISNGISYITSNVLHDVTISGDASRIVGVHKNDTMSPEEYHLYVLENQSGDYVMLSDNTSINIGPIIALSLDGSKLLLSNNNQIVLYEWLENNYQFLEFLNTSDLTNITKVEFTQDRIFVMSSDKFSTFMIDDTYPYFTFDVLTQTITAYNFDGGLNVTIPKTIKGVDVLRIGQDSMNDHLLGSQRLLTNVFIPEGIIEIGSWAFFPNDLRNITIPQSVTTIGEYAFDVNNNLETVRLPANVSMPDSAFAYGLGIIYNSTGKLAGLYTRISETEWVRSE